MFICKCPTPFSIQYVGVHLNTSCLSCTNLAAQMLAYPGSSKQPVQTNQTGYKLLVLQINKASWKCVKGTIHNQIFVRKHCYHPNVHPSTLLASCKIHLALLYGISDAYCLQFHTTAIQQHDCVHGPTMRPIPSFCGYVSFDAMTQVAAQASTA